jgi:hypothetical protein
VGVGGSRPSSRRTSAAQELRVDSGNAGLMWMIAHGDVGESSRGNTSHSLDTVKKVVASANSRERLERAYIVFVFWALHGVGHGGYQSGRVAGWLGRAVNSPLTCAGSIGGQDWWAEKGCGKRLRSEPSVGSAVELHWGGSRAAPPTGQLG